MTNNSNQTGALLLIAIVLGAAVYALMFFSSNIERTNMSDSFGQLSNKTSVNLLSNNKESVAAEFSANEIHSDLTGVTLPTHKMKSTSGGDYAQSSNLDFPTTGIEQTDVQTLNGVPLSNRTNTSGNYARNRTQSFAFGNSEVQYISNPQNPTKSDVNALLLLDTHVAEVVMNTQQGSKRATPALAAKTASVSTNLDSKSTKKVDGDPGDPGASLPVGDGVWILLALAGAYTVSRFAFRVPCFVLKSWNE